MKVCIDATKLVKGEGKSIGIYNYTKYLIDAIVNIDGIDLIVLETIRIMRIFIGKILSLYHLISILKVKPSSLFGSCSLLTFI